jgi:hypothetical protein
MDPAEFDLGNYLTISAWVRLSEETPENRGIVTYEVDGSWQALLYMSKDFVAFRVNAPGFGTEFPRADLSFGEGCYVDKEWHHIVGTYNRFGDASHSVASLYIDGVQVAQDDSQASLPILSGPGDLIVGRWGGGGFSGDIDEVNVLNYEWTPSTIGPPGGRPNVAANLCGNDPAAVPDAALT